MKATAHVYTYVYNIITAIALVIVFVCGSMLDSENTLPLKLTCLALAWLLWWTARREGVL